jgi:hypothetical protein
VLGLGPRAGVCGHGNPFGLCFQRRRATNSSREPVLRLPLFPTNDLVRPACLRAARARSEDGGDCRPSGSDDSTLPGTESARNFIARTRRPLLLGIIP